MERNLRVHIATVGHDAPDRIAKPLVELRADKAYLLSHEKDDEKARGVLESVQVTLKKKAPTCIVNIDKIDVWSLQSCLERYRDIFWQERGNHRYANVSTGSKFASIAGMLACMLWDGLPYYAVVDYAKPQNPVMHTEFLPAFTIRQPDRELLAILQVLVESGGRMSKRDLIRVLQVPRLGLIKMYGDNVSKTAPHSKLRAYLTPLERDWKFVETKTRGRNSEVSLTEKGKQALQIFGLPSQAQTS